VRQKGFGCNFTNGRWAPGQSGNPGGRPGGVAEVRELARTHTAAAIERLVQEMTNGETSHARIAAANALLDRAYGKPTQPIGEDPEMPLSQMTIEARVALATAAIDEAFAEVVGGRGDCKAEGLRPDWREVSPGRIVPSATDRNRVNPCCDRSRQANR
jgi:hypothetical protein